MKTPLLLLCSSLLSGQGWTDLGSNTQLILASPVNGWNAGTVQNGYTQENYAWHDNFHTITDFSGAAVDTKRNRLVVVGGGHSAYRAASAYTVDLTGASTSQQLNAPSVEDGTFATWCPVNAAFDGPGVNPSDNSPVPRHTYGSLVYIPTIDKLFMIDGGNLCAASQEGLMKTWLMDMSNPSAGWVDPTPSGDSPYAIAVANGGITNTGSFCNFDPNQGTKGTVVCYISGPTRGMWIGLYDVAGNSWSIPGGGYPAAVGSVPLGDEITSAIDPIRRKMYFFGLNQAGSAFQAAVVDLAHGSNYHSTDITSSVVGCSALGVISPGFAYEPSRGVFVGWPNAGNSVIVFDPQNYTCTTHTFSGGPGAGATTGTYGRWAYAPALRKFVILNNISADTFTFALDHDPVPGIGSSTLTCMDMDGDGYGVGPGCTGPDSDDRDSTVHTADQGCTKYGGTTCATQSSLVAFLKHLGYSATGNIYYLSNSGSDASTGGVPNCRNNVSAPCLTYGYLTAQPLGNDDIVLLRSGYDASVTCVAGTLGHPSVLIAYPGEQALFDAVAVAGGGVSCTNQGYMIFDGYKLQHGGFISTQTTQGSPGDLSPNITIRHIETIDGGTHVLDSAISLRVGASNLLIENSVFHDNTTGHGLYVGTQGGIPSTGGVIQRNISYGNQNTGIQTTGDVQSWTIQQNLIYNVGGAGLSHENGMSYSRDLSNVIFNQGSAAIVTFSYPGNEGSNNCGSGGTSLCTCGPPNLFAICAYSQNFNVYAHNTTYNTGKSGFDGTDVTSNPSGIEISHSGCSASSPHCQSSTFDNNSYFDNIVSSWGGFYSTLPFYYRDENLLCPSGTGACQEWLSTSSLDHNDGYGASYPVGTYLGFQNPSGTNNALTVSGAAAYTTVTGSITTLPPFTSASLSYWNNITAFNFKLSSNVTGVLSPATYDILGTFRKPTPSLGAYEFAPPTLAGGAAAAGKAKWGGPTVIH